MKTQVLLFHAILWTWLALMRHCAFVWTGRIRSVDQWPLDLQPKSALVFRVVWSPRRSSGGAWIWFIVNGDLGHKETREIHRKWYHALSLAGGKQPRRPMRMRSAGFVFLIRLCRFFNPSYSKVRTMCLKLAQISRRQCLAVSST